MIKHVLTPGGARDKLQLCSELPGALCSGAAVATGGPGHVGFLADRRIFLAFSRIAQACMYVGIYI